MIYKRKIETDEPVSLVVGHFRGGKSLELFTNHFKTVHVLENLLYEQSYRQMSSMKTTISTTLLVAIGIESTFLNVATISDEWFPYNRYDI